RCASLRWSARLLSIKVIARARLARSPERMPDASVEALAGFIARLAAFAATSLRRPLVVAEPVVQRLQELLRRLRDHRTGREDRLGAGLQERVVILRRHHAADHDHDVVAALARELLLE